MNDNADMPALRELLHWMVQSGASDLHLSAGLPPVYRRHGALTPHPSLPALSDDDLFGALDDVASDAGRARLEGELELDQALEVDGVGRFRVNISRERGHLAFAFRLVSDSVVSMEDLGLPAVCNRLTQLPRGLVLVTGPTGSGKSTTLASMIDRINEREARHIVTVEDPIEFVHANKQSIVHQREVGHGHALVCRGPAPRPAPGPGRDPRRRDARPGNDVIGDHSSRDGAPRACDAAHARCAADHRPHR